MTARTIDFCAFSPRAVAASALLIGIVGLGSPQKAVAQAVDIPAMVLPDRAAPATAASIQYGYQFEADVEDAGTEMSRHNALFTLGHRFDLSEKTNFFVLGTYTLHGYDFSGNGGGPSPSVTNFYQWNDVHRGVLAGVFGHQVNDRLRILGGGLIRSWAESGADFGDSLTGGLLTGFDFRSSEDLTLGLLVGVFNSLAGGVGLLPVPTLDWRFADAWKLHVGMVTVMDPGVGADLTWRLTDELSLGGGFAFQSREFRLRDKTRAGGRPSRPNRFDDGGIGKESEIPVFASLRWLPTPKSAIDLQGGVALRGNLRVEDEDGGRIADDDYDPAGLLTLKATVLF